ncbi:MAG TPA: hypothetical protein VHM91_00700 [Verrucomicrobiales bacterium]|nr:hypothetical protein [Verrucomicrobiales bacterium]
MSLHSESGAWRHIRKDPRIRGTGAGDFPAGTSMRIAFIEEQ